MSLSYRSPKADRYFIGCHHGTVTQVSFRHQKVISTFQAFPDVPITAMKTTHSQKFLFAGSSQGSLLKIDLSNLKPSIPFNLTPTYQSIQIITITPCDEYIFLYFSPNIHLYQYSITTSQLIKTIPIPKYLFSLQISPDNSLALLGLQDGWLAAIPISPNPTPILGPRRVHTKGIHTVALTPDGQG